jgi:hypothetical protein
VIVAQVAWHSQSLVCKAIVVLGNALNVLEVSLCKPAMSSLQELEKLQDQLKVGFPA